MLSFGGITRHCRPPSDQPSSCQNCTKNIRPVPVTPNRQAPFVVLCTSSGTGILMCPSRSTSCGYGILSSLTELE
ncbi:hypothetical protein B0H19DRAFT_1173087 [Mycena capillaripes]|nr:hypothetical protein B0H19DRAFT_1173087 [Mycena capillaripes]